MNKNHIVVFSGGSAANNLVDVFGKVAEDKGCSLSYIIPISDNGGSTSEIIRVFGGPGIGDARSRLVRLIPSSPSQPETVAIKAFFNHRLSSSSKEAREEWLSLIELQHPLWENITSAKRELIRSFLTTINLEIVKRLRPTSAFNFQSASVGNLFLTGARLFTGSFESAIYLLGAITGVPSNVDVVPAINSNFSHHISAGLQDGTVITGQNSISHPSAPSNPLPVPGASTPLPISTSYAHSQESAKQPNLNLNLDFNLDLDASHDPISPTTRTSLELYTHDTIEDANLPGSLPTLRKQYITFAKTHNEDLSSRISRIWYINPYGQEMRPKPNTQVLSSLEDASAVVYSIGSLYTSIIPCLILRDVGERIARREVRYKILILNGSLDRETRAGGGVEFGAKDFIAAIADACASSRASSATIGEKVVAGEETYSQYVTHLIHLQGEGTPRVEREELARLGIECVRLYGRRNVGGDGGMLYDGAALGQALQAIIGGGKKSGGGMSRRNTLGIPSIGGSTN